ncbi:S1 family peptidase [Pseudomonas viridiflava]|uniref:S1 family peptidase n=1 Tax=Pseudomonas viridiflava TaxID=33069 RepID=UPI000F05A402|nr:serine protease [Pseudomonas viridiflava]
MENKLNLSKLLDHLTHTTTLITCDLANSKTSTGTGFIYDFLEEEDGTRITCIVTNKHVLKGALRAHFRLTLLKPPDSPDYGNYETITVEGIQGLEIPHPGDVDLTAIPIGPILNHAKNKDKKFYFKSIGSGITANDQVLARTPSIQEIIMIGYPIGLWDEANNLPIVRKGITATHPKRKYNNKSEFLIDCACFPGSSGSPVFLADLGGYVDYEGNFVLGAQISLLGILYAGPQFDAHGIIRYAQLPTQPSLSITSSLPINLGLVISASELLALEYEIKKQTDNLRPARNSVCRCGSGEKFKNCCGLPT